MLKDFRIAEICVFVQANGQEAIEQRLLQATQAAQGQGTQIVSLQGRVEYE